MSSASKQLSNNIEIDMTPMIDVVFQLIIFFMLVNQMVELERAPLELPIAEHALPNLPLVGESRQLVINIHKKGDLEVCTKKVDWQELDLFLQKESQVSRDPENFSTRIVSVRADYEAPYETIQKVLMECARKKIYRISFEAKAK